MTKDIKSEIMSQIRDDRIKIKAKWIFIAKSIGLKSGLALTVLLLIFLINAFFFYIKTNALLLPLHFGTALWQKVLHSLPYDLILIIIILLTLLNFIIKKFDFSYKNSFIIIFAAFLIFIIFWSFIVFSTNFNHQLRGHLEKGDVNIPFVSDFYINRCSDICNQNCE